MRRGGSDEPVPGDARIVLRDLGLVLHVPGAMAVASLPVVLLSGESHVAGPFLWTAALSGFLGQALYRVFRRSGETRLRHAMTTAALGWALVPVLGAIPFLGVAAAAGSPAPTLAHFRSVENALFEAFSGFTGTGLSVALRPSELPHALQWWRSFTEWIGGVGVILLMLSILGQGGAFRLYFSEAREEKILPTVASTARTIWWIYLLYTAASAGLLRLSGVGWWEALNHGMTGIATGGFTITDGSVAHYPAATKIALLVVLFAGATSFRVHYEVLRLGRLDVLWKDAQQRVAFVLLLGGTLLLLAETRWSRGAFDTVDVVFQWTSALTTAGFQSVDLGEWSAGAGILLAAAMVFGAASGSTGGGVKLSRVLLLWKGLFWRFRRIDLSAHEVPRFEFDGRGLVESDADERVAAAGLVIVLWGAFLWVNVLVLSHVVGPDVRLSDVLLEAASAQGNVGLSAGITRPDLPAAGKACLVVAMWIGRLEIVPVLLVVASIVRSPGRLRLRRRRAGTRGMTD